MKVPDLMPQDAPKAKPATFSAPQRLTPSEIESLRAHKRELHRKFDEIEARKAAERKAIATPEPD